MNSRLRLAIWTVVMACGSYRAFAQSGLQPGQVASSQSDSPWHSPIQLSADGISATSGLRSVAQVADKSDRAGVIWKISIAAMLAATTMDAVSSMGKQESNPLLRSSDGTFGARGIAVKGSLAALCIAPQILLRNHHELRKPFIIANSISTGLFTFAAVHNSGVAPASH